MKGILILIFAICMFDLTQAESRKPMKTFSSQQRCDMAREEIMLIESRGGLTKSHINTAIRGKELSLTCMYNLRNLGEKLMSAKKGYSRYFATEKKSK